MFARSRGATGVVLTIFVASAAALASACGSDSNAAPGGDVDASTIGTGNGSAGLPCDVDAVLAKSCRSCHSSSPQFGAPMPLVTLADLHADAKLTSGKKVYEVVGKRIHDDAAPMPQPPNPRLGNADLATLDTWIAAGAPAGTTACGDTDGGTPIVQPLSCTPDQKIRPGTKWTVTGATDEYVCYGFDTNATDKRHVIAGAPRIDNPAVVHHVLVYQADTSVDPTPTPCGAGGGPNWRLVTGWAPGGTNFEMPPEAGFAEEVGTTHWAVQIHYNNASGLPNQVDESGYDFCTTTDLRPNDADVMATGTMEIAIPPRSTHTTTCNLTVPAALGNITVVGSWAHMHRLGKAQSATRIRQSAETSLLDAPNYDFNTGAAGQTVRVDIAAGDGIRTICKWQNKTGDPVSFGEDTGDEMCFAFLTYYPKIQIEQFHWAVPSLPFLSKCTSETESLGP